MAGARADPDLGLRLGVVASMFGVIKQLELWNLPSGHTQHHPSA